MIKVIKVGVVLISFLSFLGITNARFQYRVLNKEGFVTDYANEIIQFEKENIHKKSLKKKKRVAKKLVFEEDSQVMQEFNLFVAPIVGSYLVEEQLKEQSSFFRMKVFREMFEEKLNDLAKKGLATEDFEHQALVLRQRFMSMYGVYWKANSAIYSYDEIIKKNAKKYGVPVEVVQAVITQESHGDANAQSYRGAKGLMQIIDSTAELFDMEDSFDPQQNISTGVRHIRGMMIMFDNNLEFALAAYNAGGGRVKQYNGIPPFPETQNYVVRVIDYSEIYRRVGN